MKRALEVIGWLTAVALFAFAGHAVLAAPPAHAASEPAAAQTQPADKQDGERRVRTRKTRPPEDLSPGSLAREARAPLGTTHDEQADFGFRF